MSDHPLGEDYFHGPAPSTTLEEPGSRGNVEGQGTWGSAHGASPEAVEAAAEAPLSKLKKDELIALARGLNLEVEDEDAVTVKELRASIEDEREYQTLAGEARDLGVDPDGYEDTDELRDAVDEARAASAGE